MKWIKKKWVGGAVGDWKLAMVQWEELCHLLRWRRFGTNSRSQADIHIWTPVDHLIIPEGILGRNCGLKYELETHQSSMIFMT